MILSGNAKDLTGQRFGYLIAQEPVGEKNGCVVWHCKCDCGGRSIVNTASLRNGSTKSCGCLHGGSSLCTKCTKPLCDWLKSYPARDGLGKWLEMGMDIREVKVCSWRGKNFENQTVYVVKKCPLYEG